MKVVNYNENLRKILRNLIIEITKKEEYLYLFYQLYDDIKNKCGIYDYLLGLAFESAYLVTSISLKHYPQDKELLKSFSYLKSFYSIEELKESLTINTFINLLEDVTYFYDSALYYKREAVKNALDDKEFIMSIFPSFLIDALTYLNRYDASVIVDEYYERVKENSENAFNDTISMSTEDLIRLEKEDFDSYKYIILEMIEYYYKYKKYLLSNNLLYDEFDIDIISMIEEDLLSTVYFSISNKTLLEKIISGYLEYKLLSNEKLEEINEHYNNKNNKKAFIKIMKKSYELKNQKNR